MSMVTLAVPELKILWNEPCMLVVEVWECVISGVSCYSSCFPSILLIVIGCMNLTEFCLHRPPVCSDKSDLTYLSKLLATHRSWSWWRWQCLSSKYSEINQYMFVVGERMMACVCSHNSFCPSIFILLWVMWTRLWDFRVLFSPSTYSRQITWFKRHSRLLRS